MRISLVFNVRTATLGLASTALMAASNACIALVGGKLMVSCEQRGGGDIGALGIRIATDPLEDYNIL